MMRFQDRNEDESTCSLASNVRMLTSLKDEVHVYLAFSNKHSDPDLLAWYRTLLSGEELEKYKSFKFGQDRDLYLTTHGLVRTALSRYSEVTPDRWVFQYNPFGRPEIAQSDGNSQLRFSISRTDEMVVCLIVFSIDAGIDVEKIRKLDDMETLSENILTHPEILNLRSLPVSEQVEGFFTFWTLKEAYIKARGEGLSLPLNRFSFYFDAKSGIRISVDPELQDIPSDWQFTTFRPAPSHAMAVALHRRNGADLRIRFFEATPDLNGLSFLPLTPSLSSAERGEG
jgi:4'-phosphopantetheinyl transferase